MQSRKIRLPDTPGGRGGRSASPRIYHRLEVHFQHRDASFVFYGAIERGLPLLRHWTRAKRRVLPEGLVCRGHQPRGRWPLLLGWRNSASCNCRGGRWLHCRLTPYGLDSSRKPLWCRPLTRHFGKAALWQDGHDREYAACSSSQFAQWKEFLQASEVCSWALHFAQV
nr:uncharacterized protein LOC129380577 isoform X2 [Dermacentor andersoni]